MRPKVEYALYHGDTFLDIGTAEQLATKFDKSVDFIWWLSYPIALRRYDAGKVKRYLAVRLDVKVGGAR